MSRPDGYEELPGGTEREPLRLAPPGVHTMTTAAASSHEQQQQAAAPPGASGAPAQHQTSLSLRLPAAFPDYLAEVPSVVDEWSRATVLLSVWLACSVGTLVMALAFFNTLGLAAGVCGVVGASMHRCRCCQGRGDLSYSVRTIRGLAVATAVLSSIICCMELLLSFGISATCSTAEDPSMCAQLAEITGIAALWHIAYTGLSIAVARRAATMQQLLNPVSSGVVTL